MTKIPEEKNKIFIPPEIHDFPDASGIYKFFDQQGKILYVGKAKNLKKRVKSYFRGTNSHPYRIQVLVSKIRRVQYTATHTEIEALTLENNLIKEYQPRYNILLKDGKTYPYICIKNERFPRVFHTRKKIADGSSYYGPFPTVKTMHELMALIRKNYQLRTCKLNLSQSNIANKKFKLCLEYQIGNCGGPCVGLVEQETYDTYITDIEHMLNGNLNPILKKLKEKMQTAAQNYEFELANTLKLRLEALARFKKKNVIISEKINDIEVVGILSQENLVIANHFKIVNGTIIQTHSWEFKRNFKETDHEFLEPILNFLIANTDKSKLEVVTNLEVPNTLIPENIKLVNPKAGDKKKLLELSLKNCKLLLHEKLMTQTFKKQDKQEILMEQMRIDLRLKKPPLRIECFDNSNIQGTNPVASMVVFINGKPANKEYRKYKIKTVTGPDDFKSMEEVVYRRYKRLLEEESDLPNLIVIDGGKGQLSSAHKSLVKLGIEDRVPVIGIAKKLEEIYYVGDPFPLHLDKRSYSLKVIQQIRNEAHRFAINFHRNLRSKNEFKTVLSEINGIGDKTIKALLKEYKSVTKIINTPRNQLVQTIGEHKTQILMAWINKQKPQ